MQNNLLPDWQKHVNAFIRQKKLKRRINASSARNYLAELHTGQKAYYRVNRFKSAHPAKKLYEWLMAENITQPQANDIELYIEYLQRKGLSLKSINKSLSIIRNFFRYLDQYDIYENNVQYVENFRIKKTVASHDRNAINVEMLATMIAAADTASVKGARDCAMMKLAFYRGLRIRTLSELRRRDFVFNSRENRYNLTIANAKNRQESFTVIVPDPAAMAIEHYLTVLDRNGIVLTAPQPLFISVKYATVKPLSPPSISMILKNYIRHLAEVGLIHTSELPKYTAHSFKHGFVSMLINGGFTLDQTRALAEHLDIQTTLVYHSEMKFKQTETQLNDFIRNLDNASGKNLAG